VKEVLMKILAATRMASRENMKTNVFIFFSFFCYLLSTLNLAYEDALFKYESKTGQTGDKKA